MFKFKKVISIVSLITIMSSTAVLAVDNTSTNLKTAPVHTLAYSSKPYVTSVWYTRSDKYSFSIKASDGFNCSIATVALVGYNHYTDGFMAKALQLLLNHYGYNLDVDGQFGPNTHSALMSFQDKYGLSVDGVCGPNTWKALIDNF